MNVGELLIRIGADTRGVRDGVNEAERELERLPEERRVRIVIDTDDRGGNGGGGGGLQRHRTMLNAIISLLPIAAAGIEASVGALGGLVSMLGAATAGTAGFAAVAVSTLNDVFEAQKNITKANEDMAKASTEAERATAVKNLAQAYQGLSTYQLAALSSLQKFKAFWDDFAGSFQKPVVIGFSQALNGLQRVLQEMRPAIMGSANATLSLFQRFREFSNTTEFREFFGWLGGSAGTAINTFGIMAMNMLRGVMNLMVAFQPVSMAMQGGFRGLSESFVRWTQSLKDSDKFKEFVNFTIAFGPTFLNFIKQLSVFLGDLIHALAPLGTFMLRLINVVFALFNAFTAFVLSLSSAKRRVDDLANSIRALFGFQKKTATDMTDSLIDVDKVYKDIFGSVGDMTVGINDSKKAMDGFLASFDEVHQVPDFSESGGGFTPPTPPSGGGNGGNPWNQPVMDDAEVQASTGWLDRLLEKIKQIPPLIPLKIDPPDGGSGLAAVAIGGLVTTLGILTANTGLVKQGWTAMTQGLQIDIATTLPVVLGGLGTLGLSLLGLTPIMSLTHINWKGMFDTMQSMLNAYRPYLEYGVSLIALSLGNLQGAQLALESAWGKSWQTMYANQVVQSNKMIDAFEAVQRAYASMKAAIGEGSVSPAMHPVGKQSLVMDDLIGSGAGAYSPAPASAAAPSVMDKIASALKSLDYASTLKDAAKDLGEFGIEVALALTGLKAAQVTGKAAEVGWPAVKAWMENLAGGGAGKALTGFANGGIIGTDSIVRVGEQGRQEAIIPMGGSAMQPFASAIASNMGGGGGNSGGKQEIVLQIDGVEFARVTAPYNIQESQRIGGNMISIK